MKWQIVTIGKPALAWARMGTAEYHSRLTHMAPVNITALREGTALQNAQRSLEAAKGATLKIVLDEKGRQMTSEDFSRWITKQELIGRKQVSVFIGGADGHHDSLRESADELWSLTSMTLQHEMALVIFLEQLYRAYSIQKGLPYHRSG